MKVSSHFRGFTIIELLVVIGITGIIASLLLPAVQSARETARRADCVSRLRQMGLALQSYHQIYHVLPAGFDGGFDLNLDDKRWAWGVSILPFIEQAPLYRKLQPNELSLFSTVFNAQRRRTLQTEVPFYHCPSDDYMRLSDKNRDFSGPPTAPVKGSNASLSAFHLNHLGFRASPSNYVGNFGDFWNPYFAIWTDEELRGNGILGCQSTVSFANITDGLSNTLAVGERDSTRYAAVWCGVEAWNQCTTQGVSMVVGSAHYAINTPATDYAYTCEGGGASGFGSKHWGGANFVFCDGSTHFLSDQMDSRTPVINAPRRDMGVFQRMARYDDGESVELP